MRSNTNALRCVKLRFTVSETKLLFWAVLTAVADCVYTIFRVRHVTFAYDTSTPDSGSAQGRVKSMLARRKTRFALRLAMC